MDFTDNLAQDSSGVSRCGRVRKKSTRMTEFESSEESDAKSPKKKSPIKLFNATSKMSKNAASLLSDLSSDSDDSDLDDKDKDGDSSSDTWDEAERNMSPLLPPNLARALPPNVIPLRPPLHISEKHPLIPNSSMGAGYPIKPPRKAERKDKGSSRCNAYMVWAKETRPTLVAHNPHMDFTEVSKKLGAMWSKVPEVQKQTYTRMAKRIVQQGDALTPTSQMIRTGKSQKIAKKNQLTHAHGKMSKSQDTKKLPGQSGGLVGLGGSHMLPGSHRLSHMGELSHHQSGTGRVRQNSTGNFPSSGKESTDLQRTSGHGRHPSSSEHGSASLLSGPLSPAFKVNGTTPIDVSAHLKLLGESLNNIGQKLKENEGQIAVSGSLSVLLDSMLCVLGPLACLTQQVDETRGAIPDDTLNGILDNIAYIMPGIV